MKRKILSVLLTVAMTVSVLAGCGNGNAGEQTDGNTQRLQEIHKTAELMRQLTAQKL